VRISHLCGKITLDTLIMINAVLDTMLNMWHCEYF